MIRYSLRCRDGHAFESWFRSGSAYDALRDARQVACPDCNSTEVEKALMTPRVSGQDAAPEPAKEEHPLAELRRRVEAQSDYVGADFVKEARAMHEGSSARRAIYGEARIGEARKLVEDGIPVAPLPFLPRAKVN